MMGQAERHQADYTNRQELKDVMTGLAKVKPPKLLWNPARLTAARYHGIRSPRGPRYSPDELMNDLRAPIYESTNTWRVGTTVRRSKYSSRRYSPSFGLDSAGELGRGYSCADSDVAQCPYFVKDERPGTEVAQSVFSRRPGRNVLDVDCTLLSPYVLETNAARGTHASDDDVARRLKTPDVDTRCREPILRLKLEGLRQLAGHPEHSGILGQTFPLQFLLGRLAVVLVRWVLLQVGKARQLTSEKVSQAFVRFLDRFTCKTLQNEGCPSHQGRRYGVHDVFPTKPISMFDRMCGSMQERGREGVGKQVIFRQARDAHPKRFSLIVGPRRTIYSK
jgi:hypothetical protein